MSSEGKAMRGMTLIELVMAIVILGIGLAGVLLAFSTVVRSSADPLIRKQMLAIAEQMMEEICLKPYVQAETHLPTANCARDTWNAITDYNSYDSSASNCVSGGPPGTASIYDVTGSPIASLAGYSVSVVLDGSPLAGIAEAKRITVTASHGTQSIQLIGWRANYAAP